MKREANHQDVNRNETSATVVYLLFQ